MSEHPVNLALRFALEVIALVFFGVWGWHVGGDDVARITLATAVPLLAGVLWGVVATDRDVVRSTKAPIMVPGAVRLALEGCIFIGAALAMYAAGFQVIGIAYVIVVVIQNALSWDRWKRLTANDHVEGNDMRDHQRRHI